MKTEFSHILFLITLIQPYKAQCLFSITKMFPDLSHGKKGTVMPAEQYSSVLTQAPPELGQLEKTMQENRELQA